MLAASATASASQFEFEACGADMRIRYDDLSSVIWLDIYNTGQGKWDWTVNREVDTYVLNTQTPEQFLGDFLVQVETKINSYCEANGGGEVPTDFVGLLKHMIINNLEYDASSQSVVIK